MVRGRLLHSIFFAFTFGLATCASAGVTYNEATAGDFSGSGLAPTSLGALSLGLNQVFGSTGATAGVTDRDYFSFSIPNGFRLSAIVERPGTQSGNLSFIGLEEGPQLTLAPTATTAAGLLGWWHYSPADIDMNVLADMATPSRGSSGFSAPLHSGIYTLWVQDTSAGSFAYGFDLLVVPEPATYALVSLGLGACVLSTRRRRKEPIGCRTI